MSEILIGQDADKPEQSTVLPDTPELKAKQLPQPSGYHILCVTPEIDGTYESGIVKADVTRSFEERLTTVLFVISLGKDCYKDEKKFPSGPWCKQGDFVLVRPHSGSRIKIHNREFRMICDDMVEATVEDPRGVARA